MGYGVFYGIGVGGDRGVVGVLIFFLFIMGLFNYNCFKDIFGIQYVEEVVFGVVDWVDIQVVLVYQVVGFIEFYVW